MKNCKIIAVCGTDRVGKATQSKKITSYLQNQVVYHNNNGLYVFASAKRIEVPIKGLFHSSIYWMLKNGLALKFPNLFQTVQFFNKLVFQTFTLPRLQKHCDYVVFDRWKLSTWVYGSCTGVHPWLLKFYDWCLITPDVTIVLYGKAQVEETRDAYEKNTSLQNNVRAGYMIYASEHDNHFIVDANQSIENVFIDIENVLLNAKTLQ